MIPKCYKWKTKVHIPLLKQGGVIVGIIFRPDTIIYEIAINENGIYNVINLYEFEFEIQGKEDKIEIGFKRDKNG